MATGRQSRGQTAQDAKVEVKLLRTPEKMSSCTQDAKGDDNLRGTRSEQGQAKNQPLGEKCASYVHWGRTESRHLRHSVQEVWDDAGHAGCVGIPFFFG